MSRALAVCFNCLVNLFDAVLFFVIAVFVTFSPTQRYTFLNYLLLDCRNMAILLFALIFLLSAVQPVASPIRSPDRVTVDTDTSARASSDSLYQDNRVPGVLRGQLGIAQGGRHCRRPARKRPYRGGHRKQGRTVPVIVSDRPAPQPRTLRPLTTPTLDSARRLSDDCDMKNAIYYSNLIKIDTSPYIQKLSIRFKLIALVLSLRQDN